jgi:DNA-binding GntR family transcriptional regulator
MTHLSQALTVAHPAGEFEDHSPVYRQIALILRERIGTVWRPGDELPSEGDIAREFGVNRNTLRRAIGVLVDEGVLDRRRGVRLKVARLPVLERPKLEADPTQLFRMRPGTAFKVLSFALQPLPADAAVLLDLPAATEVFRIDRLLMSGSDVLALLVVYLPVDIGKKLIRMDLTSQTITSILHSKIGVRTGRVRQTIEAGLADAAVAGALGMAAGGATLRCRYVVADEVDRPIQAATYYYPGDRFRLTLEIETSAGADGGARRLEDWPLTVTSSRSELRTASPVTKRRQ